MSEQWTPINTSARQIVELLHASGLMRIEVGPGGKRRQLAYDIVERCIQVIDDEYRSHYRATLTP